MTSTRENLIFIILLASSLYSVFGSKKYTSSKVTTVKTIYGDVYKCVDVHKQPSLKHPALKDPALKEKVHKHLAEVVAKMKSEAVPNPFHEGIWIEKGCPIGTVPLEIRKARQQVKPATSSFKPSTNHSLVQKLPPTHFAGIAMEENKYSGAQAYINIYNPQVASDQYTTASIFVETNHDPINQIQVGWTVNPSLYGDQRTRLYTAWTTDNYQKTGCYNTQCPGFLQTNNRVPLGFVFPNISRREYEQFDSGFIVERGWVLKVGNPPEVIGYWLPYLFTDMKGSASIIRFGGEVYASPSDEKLPPMGSGPFKADEWDKTCYMRQVLVWVLSGDSPKAFYRESLCYLSGNSEVSNDPYWSSRFLFGGGGGIPGFTCV